MRYFLDTEFLEDGKTIMPISLGIVAQDARELYIEMQFDQSRVEAHSWLRENVLPHLRWKAEERLDRAATAAAISEFIGEDTSPEFWAYFADYDWVVICQIFGTMRQLPTSFSKFCMDLQQWYVQLGRPDGVKPPQPFDAHDALADARWNAELYDRLAAHARARGDVDVSEAYKEWLGECPDCGAAYDIDECHKAFCEIGKAEDRHAGEISALALDEARTVVDEQHGEIVTLRTERHRTRTERDALWVLLDDIDTASDMFKDNYEGLAKYTYRKQQERHAILKSDGYSVVRPGEDFPHATHGQPMATNASPDATLGGRPREPGARSVAPHACSHPPCHCVSNADGEGRMRCGACGAWKDAGEEWASASTLERGDPAPPSPRST